MVERQDSRFSGVKNVIFTDANNDGQNEFSFVANANSTAENILFLATLDDVTNTLNVDWFSSGPENIKPPYAGGITTEPGVGGLKATFVSTSSTNILEDFFSYRSVEESGRLIYIDPQDGTYNETPPVFYPESILIDTPMITGLDFDLDSSNEIYLADQPHTAAGGTIGSVEMIVDPETQSLLWESVGSTDRPIAIASADFNGDNIEEIVTILGSSQNERRLQVKDINNNTLLWESTTIGDTNGNFSTSFVKIHDLIPPLDGIPEILVAIHQELSIYQYNPDNQVFDLQLQYNIETNNIISGLAVGDLNGDSNAEIAISLHSYNIATEYNLLVMNHQLDIVSRFLLDGRLQSIEVEDLGTSRKNLLIALQPSFNSHITESTNLLLVDPFSGREIWRSPYILGVPQNNSLNVTDITQDGSYELLMGTSKAMYVTR